MTGDNSDDNADTNDTLPPSETAKVTTTVKATTTPAKATKALATASPTKTTTDEVTAKTTAALQQTAQVKQQLLDFSELQKKIITNIAELNKLSEQADTFMNKFESYKNQSE